MFAATARSLSDDRNPSLTNKLSLNGCHFHPYPIQLPMSLHWALSMRSIKNVARSSNITMCTVHVEAEQS